MDLTPCFLPAKPLNVVKKETVAGEVDYSVYIFLASAETHDVCYKANQWLNHDKNTNSHSQRYRAIRMRLGHERSIAAVFVHSNQSYRNGVVGRERGFVAERFIRLPESSVDLD